jgi:hypothetical protein
MTSVSEKAGLYRIGARGSGDVAGSKVSARVQRRRCQTVGGGEERKKHVLPRTRMTCSLLPQKCAPRCASSKSITHGALRGTTPSSGGVRGVRDDRTDDPFKLASLSLSFPLPFPFPFPYTFPFPYPFGADVCLTPLDRYDDGGSPFAAPGISGSDTSEVCSCSGTAPRESSAPDEDRRDPAMDGLDREKRSRSRDMDMLEGREEELGLGESLSTTGMVMPRSRCIGSEGGHGSKLWLGRSVSSISSFRAPSDRRPG